MQQVIIEAKNASEAAIKGQEYHMDIEGLIINSVIAVLFGTLEAFKATPGVPELQERVKSGDPAAIKEATDFINTHVDEIEAAAKEQYKAILDIEAKTPNTELNIDSNTIDSAVTPQDGAQAMQQVGGIQTPAQTQNAPTQNAPKASVDGTILRAREMWSQGNPASTIFNETGKIIGKDGSVYSESGELQMNANGDIMSPEGGVAGDANKGTNSSGNNGTYEWSTGRTGVNAGGNNGIGGGLDKGTGKPWSALDTGTTQQLTKVFRNHVIAEAGSELSILKNAYVKRYGSEAAAVTEMAKRFYEDLSMSPVIAENRWANFIPKLSELVDSFNKLSAQRSSNNTQIMPGGMGERSGSTYESLSDPRTLRLLEQYNSNVPKTEAEKRAELARIYEELAAEQQAGKTAVEKDTAQGYNGNWNRLYDQNVQGTGESYGRTAEGAGDAGLDSDILIDSYKNMRNNPDVTGQSHHLNQDAAFRDVIPKNDGLCVELEGNAFRDVGSPHYSAHENLENFWNKFRSKGDLFGDTPKISDYNSALYNSLRAAGLSDAQAKVAVQNAVKQQSQYGLAGNSFVPRIPGRINFKR